MEQLPNVVQFFAAQLPVVAEPVIEVPKILPHDVPPRSLCRDTQLAEQLVEVPTIVSNSLLQRIVEQNVDIPVPGYGGRYAGLQGFPPEQSSTASGAEQIFDFPSGGGFQGFLSRQGSRSANKIVAVPASGAGLQDFLPGQSFILFFARSSSCS